MNFSNKEQLKTNVVSTASSINFNSAVGGMKLLRSSNTMNQSQILKDDLKMRNRDMLD